ncbi:hypothetical protein MTP99_014656 [Tenebrio molitor]|nr:hypothetical protein MTP99_014656 [Tenebrio molitor]
MRIRGRHRRGRNGAGVSPVCVASRTRFPLLDVLIRDHLQANRCTCLHCLPSENRRATGLATKRIVNRKKSPLLEAEQSALRHGRRPHLGPQGNSHISLSEARISIDYKQYLH